MKKLLLFASFLMLGSITNKISAQVSDVEGTIMSISSNKLTGLVSSLETGEVFQFVNNNLIDVLPGDKVIIVEIPVSAKGINEAAPQGPAPQKPKGIKK